jgi:hypothetical protein
MAGRAQLLYFVLQVAAGDFYRVGNEEHTSIAPPVSEGVSDHRSIIVRLQDRLLLLDLFLSSGAILSAKARVYSSLNLDRDTATFVRRSAGTTPRTNAPESPKHGIHTAGGLQCAYFRPPPAL